MRNILLIFGLIALAACAHSPVSGTDHIGEEKVLSRIDGMSARPSWLNESEPFRIENGKVYSLGRTTIPGDHRVEAGFRIADNNGKASVATAIEQKLEFVFQNAEEGTSMDSNQARYIGSEAAHLSASSIRLGHHYWEKLIVIGENGQPQTQYRVFSEIVMPESDFKAAIIDAARKAQGKLGLSADFAQKVDKQWNKLVEEPANVAQGQ